MQAARSGRGAPFRFSGRLARCYKVSVRSRPALIRLLAVLLLMQWGTAFGHCLRLAAPDGLLHLEICTTEGLRSVSLAA